MYHIMQYKLAYKKIKPSKQIYYIQFRFITMSLVREYFLLNYHLNFLNRLFYLPL